MSRGSEAKQEQQAASTGDHWKVERDSPHWESSNENESHHPNQVCPKARNSWNQHSIPRFNNKIRKQLTKLGSDCTVESEDKIDDTMALVILVDPGKSLVKTTCGRILQKCFVTLPGQTSHYPSHLILLVDLILQFNACDRSVPDNWRSCSKWDAGWWKHGTDQFERNKRWWREDWIECPNSLVKGFFCCDNPVLIQFFLPKYISSSFQLVQNKNKVCQMELEVRSGLV